MGKELFPELIPEGLPDYREVLAEGKAIADAIKLGKSEFTKERGMVVADFRLAHREAGEVYFQAQIGRASLEEQVKAQKTVYERLRENGIDVGMNILTPGWLTAVPPEIRDKAPRSTSFVLEKPEDFKRIADASPMQPLFGDYICMSPNSVNNVIGAIEAGCPGVANFSGIAWKYPYCDDDVAQVVEAVKALGIMAGKVYESNEVQIQGYVGDGIASAFVDHVSELGYALFEQYIAEQLCEVPYKEGLGGLMSHIPNKLATWLAFFEALKENARYPNRAILHHYEGNTIEVSAEEPVYNYGLIVADFLPFALLERKYKTGAAYLPKPIMEAVRVPNEKEIADCIIACAAALKKVPEFEEAGFIDEADILRRKDIILEQGKKFYRNILTKLPELGVDIENPIHCLLAIKRLKGARFESLCHPGERDESRYRGIVPYFMTDLTKQTLDKADDKVMSLLATYKADALMDKKIVVCSTDTHEYGLMFMDYVLKAFGADVINIDVDTDPEDALDVASEEGALFIAVSTHNGQSLAWSERAVNEIGKRNQEVKLFMGGMLNSLQEGIADPVDVSDKIRALGVFATNDIDEMFKEFAQN